MMHQLVSITIFCFHICYNMLTVHVPISVRSFQIYIIFIIHIFINTYIYKYILYMCIYYLYYIYLYYKNSFFFFYWRSSVSQILLLFYIIYFPLYWIISISIQRHVGSTNLITLTWFHLSSRYHPFSLCPHSIKNSWKYGLYLMSAVLLFMFSCLIQLYPHGFTKTVPVKFIKDHNMPHKSTHSFIHFPHFTSSTPQCSVSTFQFLPNLSWLENSRV